MDSGHNKGIERPLYVSFFKGLAFGIFAIILKIAVSFSTWQKYVSNGSLGELENFAIYIICFVASLFVSPSLSADFGIPMSLGLRGIAMVVSLIGAFLGAGEKKSKKRKIKK